MYKDILLPVDLAHLDEEMRAVEFAVEYAQTFGSTLHMLTVVPDYGLSIVGGYFPADHERTSVARANSELRAFTGRVIPSGIRHRHIVDHGVIYRIILHYAREVGSDLVVMSSGRRLDLADYLLGPNAARVVRHAKCSVLVVRDED